MKRRHFSWLGLKVTATLGLQLTATLGPGCSPVTPAAQAPRGGPRTIRVAGDSTAAVFSGDDQRVGWGAVLHEQLASISVDAAARSGRSSKSYLDEGHWAALLGRAQAHDLVLIQFGHNDEKLDPARATDAATTFRTNLRRYVGESRAAGAIPVLLTPICRRRFEGTRIRQTHGDFPEATRSVARETKTPLIDLTEQTTVLFEGLGPETSGQLFAPDDNTHTNLQGAREIARLVARSLVELKLGVAAKAV